MHPCSQSKKVLVVDEDPEMRIFLSHLLELGGFQAITAVDALEGLQRLEEEAPDLILLAVMFDSSGRLIMFQDIKQDERFQDIPLVLISNIEKRHLYQLRILPQVPGKGLLSRPDGVLARPPEAEELLGVLKRLSQMEEA
ncbi:MAG: response regulator [Desulfohalobiaceae bacterium]